MPEICTPVTEWRRFLGMNIKGTPSMKAEAVLHDLEVADDKASVIVLQEFRWRWYWRMLAKALGSDTERGWESYPSIEVGLARPIYSAQSVLWRSSGWEKCETKRRLSHRGAARISHTRHLRAALLADVDTDLAAWFGTAHFVVGGDQDGDSRRRKRMLRANLRRLDNLLADLVATGHPVLYQLDANIRPGGWAYREFMAILDKHGATIHGRHGVEYLFTIDGKKAAVEVRRDFTIPTSRLRTDHEGRAISYRLIGR